MGEHNWNVGVLVGEEEGWNVEGCCVCVAIIVEVNGVVGLAKVEVRNNSPKEEGVIVALREDDEG